MGQAKKIEMKAEKKSLDNTLKNAKQNKVA